MLLSEFDPNIVIKLLNSMHKNHKTKIMSADISVLEARRPIWVSKQYY